MAPKAKNASIYLALSGTTIDSAYATVEAANARVAELRDGGSPAKVEVQELKGGSVTVVEEKAPAKTKAPRKEADEDAAPKAVKKTKTPAEQRAANAEKPKGKGDEEDLPENVKELLAAMGDALEGKAIVVTGVPPTLGRKNAEKLVINYGGKLTKSLSKNTSLVLVGNDAGPTKLEKIEELAIPTVDEDGFIAMLEAGGGGTKREADEDEKPKTKKPKK